MGKRVNPKHLRPRGMTAFIVISLGQMVSLMGSAMSSFALGIWAWELTGRATALALVAVFGAVPIILFSPFAGALVDRQANKKLVMMLSDLASALVTLAYLLLSSTGQLQIWHLYAGAAFVGLFSSFQFPAYTAATALMLPKDQYSRAAGISSLVTLGSGLLAPLLAGSLFTIIGLSGIFLIDLVTFSAAIFTLLWIIVPSVPSSAAARAPIAALWREAGAGLHYILARPNLLGVQTIFSAGNFFFNLSGILLTPMILARTGGSAPILGLVVAAGSLGGLFGGLLMSILERPPAENPRRIVRLAGPRAACGAALQHQCRAAGLDGRGHFQRPDPHGHRLLARGHLAGKNSTGNAGPHCLYPPGDCLSARPARAPGRRTLSRITFSNPPWPTETGLLASAFGWITGTGPGAGMGLIYLLCAVLIVVLAIIGYLIPAVRRVETVLPDYSPAPADRQEQAAVA